VVVHGAFFFYVVEIEDVFDFEEVLIACFFISAFLFRLVPGENNGPMIVLGLEQ
jgi:hypothetical protein